MSRQPRYFLTFAALFLGAGVSVAISYLVGQKSQAWIAYAGLAVGLIGLGLAFFQLGGSAVPRRIRVALVGTPGAGKTVYLTALFDCLQTTPNLPFGFAPTSETINRVLETLSGFAQGHWIASTPSDYLYLYTAQLSPKRRSFGLPGLGRVEYDVEFADVAGEQVAEFVPGEQKWLERTSYYRYALQSDALFLFVDYNAAINGKPTGNRSLAEQVNDLIFVIQAVAEASGAGPAKPLEKPVVIIITKCDLAEQVTTVKDSLRALRDVTEDLTISANEFQTVQTGLQREFNRLVAVAEARCKNVAIFGVSAVGPIGGIDKPPSHIQPVNVTPPLFWMLTRAQRGRLVRAISGTNNMGRSGRLVS